MRLWHLFFPLALLANSAKAVVTPKLDKLMVRINGSDKEIRNKERLELIRGDDLTLLYAVLEGTRKAPDILNFIGYRGEGPRRWQDDDRDILIPTSSLKKGWSLDKNGRVYKIEARTANKLHGEIFVALLTPELKNLRLQIKGVERQLKDGETVTMQEDDPIQVIDVKTNSPDVDRQLRVEFKENGKQVELRLLYRTYLFATVYLNASGS